ncbi:hypothetical protein [uncultured Ruminococcus sp.]|uniref:hypothetical protein n=1 Tax=uncultured Ruminococcus sp. TaxID=165186 RepID=UPI00292FF028|nr:hypothetical protein [uncultured Ruminococcus sp.]
MYENKKISQEILQASYEGTDVFKNSSFSETDLKIHAKYLLQQGYISDFYTDILGNFYVGDLTAAGLNYLKELNE